MIEIIPNWHPIFVHFSVGLLLTSALFHIGVMLVRSEPLKQALTHVANWNLWAGTVITAVTVAAGWYAFNTVEHDTPSHQIMLEHRNLAMMSFAAFLAVGGWSFLRARKNSPIQWPIVIACCAAGLLLISTAWHGGELVYRHGLGVMSLPNAEDHVHAQGASHDHDHENHEHDDHDNPDQESAHTNEDGHDHDHAH